VVACLVLMLFPSIQGGEADVMPSELDSDLVLCRAMMIAERVKLHPQKLLLFVVMFQLDKISMVTGDKFVHLALGE